jgi:hypothetical protein
MATYSTNLALTLLATGEGAGTWGNTTNTNLGTLLEQAISGYATESLTAGTTLTLTIPNGSTGVARNMYLEFTGDGSTVIVPSNKKLYFVYNNCSSGTITMKVAGQTGVSIPKGSKQILVSNGTDIVDAVNYANTTSATITNLSSTSATITTLIGDTVYVNTTTNLSPGGNSRISAQSKTGDGCVATLKETTGWFNVPLVLWNQANTGDAFFAAFGTDTSYSVRGTINYNRGAGLVAYNTTSDRRAKTIYGPVTNSGEKIDELNVYEGRMNWGVEIYPMMIADEMQPVVPYSVTGLPNATNPDGSPKYQQVDYSSLVPLLIAEIQSLRQRVAALESAT